MRRNRFLTASLVTALVATFAVAAPAQSPRGAEIPSAPKLRRHDHPAGKYFLARTHNGVGCRETEAGEADALVAARAANGRELHVIKSGRTSRLAGAGLTIIMRATDQLEDFPTAKNAFLRAAETWESQLSTPITVVIDVDFGPRFFGENYPSGVIGATFSQDLSAPNTYGPTRASLLDGAANATETALYTSLPSSSLPTDIGAASQILAASANFRALGLIDPVADPVGEQNSFGDPPAIGFNSDFSYDFDPSNGIDFDKTDFDAAAVHEIGHALGFGSLVGNKELSPSDPNFISVLDLFRFRPGVTSGTFTTANRILSSGGNQVFFAGSDDPALSTGRANNTGGDGNQAGHWKGDEFTGVLIGVMDPTIADGQRFTITEADLVAFDAIGYTRVGQSSVSIGVLAADLDGDVLTVTGTGSSTTGDIVSGTLSLLDSAGSTLRTYPASPLSIGSGGSFELTFSGLGDEPAAVNARLILTDETGVTSAAVVADFSTASPGGPTATKVKLKNGGAKMKLTGTGFNIQMQLEVNGVAMALPAGSKVNVTGKKATINLSSVTFQPGVNRVRVLFNGLHSNIILLTN